MRLLKKFNQYMLEHHPLTWHSRFIQLLAAGLLFWLISYVCGYLMVNLSVIKLEYLRRYYSNSNFISFHVIYCLVIICLWAIFFYKNNAVKSFYPLPRFYLVRLFVQLFIAFALLVSADIPFTAGCYAKVRALLPDAEVERDIDALNLGAAFLVTDQGSYKFNNREEVAALGYERIDYLQDKGKWEESFDYYYYPEMLDDPYIEKEPAYRDFVTSNDSNVTVIDSNRFLFFSTVTKYGGPDSCYSITLVKDFHRLDQIRNLHMYALLNYNDNKYGYLHNASLKRYKQRELPKIHRWGEAGQSDSISQAVRNLIRVCKKYEIDYDLDPELIGTYLKAKRGINLASFILSNASIRARSSFRLHYPEKYEMLDKYAAGKKLEEGDINVLTEAMESQDYLFYDYGTLQDMLGSYQTANEGFKLSDIYTCLFLAFFMAWLFLFFEFANIVSLLISIPVAGVISVLVAITLVYINIFVYRGSGSGEFDYHYLEKISFSIIFSVCLLIFLLTLCGLFMKRFNKRLLNILINLGYMLAPILIGLFLGLMNIFSGHMEYGKCDSDYEYSYTQLLHPLLLLVYAFVGVCCYFPLVIKWRAKEE